MTSLIVVTTLVIFVAACWVRKQRWPSYDVVSMTTEGGIDRLPWMNVLTRTSNRSACFATFRESFEQQTYPKKRLIVSYDDPASLAYLSNVEAYRQTKGTKSCFYNLYLNHLWGHVVDGWVMFLDDDSRFVDPKHLERLARECGQTSPSTMLLVDAYFQPEKMISPWYIEKKQRMTGDMASICVHYTFPHRFPEACGGDQKLIFAAHRDPNVQVKRARVRPPGVWANYAGKADGKRVTCEQK